jgi:hypothetical protein
MKTVDEIVEYAVEAIRADERSRVVSDIVFFLACVDWQEDTAAEAVEAHFGPVDDVP